MFHCSVLLSIPSTNLEQRFYIKHLILIAVQSMDYLEQERFKISEI